MRLYHGTVHEFDAPDPGMNTYYRLLSSNLYLNQGTLYVLEDLIRELQLKD